MGAVFSAPLLMIGEKLGLYKAMAHAGPRSAPKPARPNSPRSSAKADSPMSGAPPKPPSTSSSKRGRNQSPPRDRGPSSTRQLGPWTSASRGNKEASTSTPRRGGQTGVAPRTAAIHPLPEAAQPRRNQCIRQPALDRRHQAAVCFATNADTSSQDTKPRVGNDPRPCDRRCRECRAARASDTHANSWSVATGVDRHHRRGRRRRTLIDGRRCARRFEAQRARRAVPRGA